MERVLVSGTVTELLPISTKHCTIERDGPVVVLTMNRPEKKNALSPDMLAGLVLGYEYVDAHDDVRCAILTGAGGNFSSGMDLTAMGQTVRRHEGAGGHGARQQPALEGVAARLPLVEAVDRRGRGLRGRGRHRDPAGHRHPRRGRGRDLRRVGSQARPVPARRFRVPAPPPDPVHDRDGHPVAVPARSCARSEGDRAHRPRRSRRPGAGARDASSRPKSRSAHRCRRWRSCARGARPST